MRTFQNSDLITFEWTANFIKNRASKRQKHTYRMVLMKEKRWSNSVTKSVVDQRSISFLKLLIYVNFLENTRMLWIVGHLCSFQKTAFWKSPSLYMSVASLIEFECLTTHLSRSIGSNPIKWFFFMFLISVNIFILSVFFILHL